MDVIDLSLSTKEIQELLLTQLLQSECGDVLSQRLRFQNYNQSLREKLVTEEVIRLGSHVIIAHIVRVGHFVSWDQLSKAM